MFNWYVDFPCHKVITVSQRSKRPVFHSMPSLYYIDSKRSLSADENATLHCEQNCSWQKVNDLTNDNIGLGFDLADSRFTQ